MIDIFNMENKLDLTNITCHSGGATGADFFFFETIGSKYGVRTNAYSYKTKYHTTTNKVEISDVDYEEGVKEITKANKVLRRYGIHKFMNLLARNWAQVKYSDEVFAIGTIVDPGKKGSKGFYNKSNLQVVDGGTGYACMCAINNSRPLYVFDQEKDKWFRWSYTSLKFIEFKEDIKINFENFAGIGTREIKPNGVKAIEDLYKNTFNI
jgi:hypothetical protein